MVVIILERVPVRLRGELTRWMLELKAGVFVGKVSAMVRDKLWQRVCESVKGGGALMAHSTDNEQGFAFRFWGATSHQIVDFDGLMLVQHQGGSGVPAHV
jgi:CRISPR-associated protein Cas2